MATPMATTPTMSGAVPAGGTSSSNHAKNRNPSLRQSFPHPNSYTVLKGGFEGGDKRMLDVIFERLKHTVRAEWTEGQTVSKILDTFKDVSIEEPPMLTAEQREDELILMK